MVPALPTSTDCAYDWQLFMLAAAAERPALQAHLHTSGLHAMELAAAVRLPPLERQHAGIIGFVHDLGRIDAWALSGVHQLDGARPLHDGGHPRLAAQVAHHSFFRQENHLPGVAEELAQWEHEDTLISDIQVITDCTVDGFGRLGTLQDRLDDVQARYEPERFAQIRENFMAPDLVALIDRLLDRMTPAVRAAWAQRWVLPQA